jgi:hypothetical protein
MGPRAVPGVQRRRERPQGPTGGQALATAATERTGGTAELGDEALGVGALLWHRHKSIPIPYPLSNLTP